MKRRDDDGDEGDDDHDDDDAPDEVVTKSSRVQEPEDDEGEGPAQKKGPVPGKKLSAAERRLESARQMRDLLEVEPRPEEDEEDEIEEPKKPDVAVKRRKVGGPSTKKGVWIADVSQPATLFDMPPSASALDLSKRKLGTKPREDPAKPLSARTRSAQKSIYMKKRK